MHHLPKKEIHFLFLVSLEMGNTFKFVFTARFLTFEREQLDYTNCFSKIYSFCLWSHPKNTLNKAPTYSITFCVTSTLYCPNNSLKLMFLYIQ